MKCSRGHLLVVAIAAVPALAVAHHSFVQFDSARTLKVDGTLRGVEWANPHVWLWIEAPDQKGVPALWGIEGGSPLNSSQGGLTKKLLSVGDKVAITIHPLRDGRPGGSLVSVTLADGRVVGGAGNANQPNSARPASPVPSP